MDKFLKNWELVECLNVMNHGRVISDFSIGTVMSYPTSFFEFAYTLEIPKAVAKAWIEELKIEFDTREWVNKFAYVVSIRFDTVYAVYKHDSKYYLVTKTFNTGESS